MVGKQGLSKRVTVMCVVHFSGFLLYGTGVTTATDVSVLGLDYGIALKHAGFTRTRSPFLSWCMDL